MARTSTKTAAKPEPTERERDYAAEFAAKQEVGVGPGGWTRTQEHFGNWIADVTEVEFKTQKERDAFVLGATCGLWLRMEHQKSPENAELKAELAKAKEAAEGDKEQARADRAANRKAAAAEKAAAPAPARRTRASAKAEEPAPAPAARRGGRRRASAAAETETATASAPAKSAAKTTTRPAASGRPGRAARRGGAAKAEAEF